MYRSSETVRDRVFETVVALMSDDVCVAGNRELAVAAGVSERAVQYALREMRSSGRVEVTYWPADDVRREIRVGGGTR